MKCTYTAELDEVSSGQRHDVLEDLDMNITSIDAVDTELEIYL